MSVAFVHNRCRYQYSVFVTQGKTLVLGRLNVLCEQGFGVEPIFFARYELSVFKVLGPKLRSMCQILSCLAFFKKNSVSKEL